MVVLEDLIVFEVYVKCMFIFGWDVGLRLVKMYYFFLEVIVVIKEGEVLIEKNVKG